MSDITLRSYPEGPEAARFLAERWTRDETPRLQHLVVGHRRTAHRGAGFPRAGLHAVPPCAFVR